MQADTSLTVQGFGPSSIPLEDITSSNAARHRKKDGTKKGGKRKGKTPSGIETSRPTNDLPTNEIPAETDFADEETQFKLGDSDDDEGEGSGAKGQTGPGVYGRDDSDEDDLEWESGRR